jgi:hypothetical protein
MARQFSRVWQRDRAIGVPNTDLHPERQVGNLNALNVAYRSAKRHLPAALPRVSYRRPLQICNGATKILPQVSFTSFLFNTFLLPTFRVYRAGQPAKWNRSRPKSTFPLLKWQRLQWCTVGALLRAEIGRKAPGKLQSTNQPRPWAAQQCSLPAPSPFYPESPRSSW